MNKKLLGSLFVAACLSFSSMAWAGQPEQMRQEHFSAVHQKLTPEQRETAHKIFAAHADKMHQLHEGLWAKKTELRALVASGKADKSDIEGLIAQMSALRDQRHQERKDIRAELEAAGIKRFPMHHKGYHHGHERFESRLG